MGPRQTMPVKGNCFCSSRAGTPRGADHGHPLPENVLAGTAGAHERHATANHTGGMGGRTGAKGDRPPGPSSAGLSQTGVATAGAVVEMDVPGGTCPDQLGVDSQSYVVHVFRETPRRQQLRKLEIRRPRLFGGMGANIHRALTLAHIANCDNELDRAMLRGALMGVLWTAVRAQARGLGPTNTCPFCSTGLLKDEEHLLWCRSAPTQAREFTERLATVPALMRKCAGQSGAD